VCRLSVDQRNFTRINDDESFKCRTEYRILKYEHVCVKKYIFKGVKNERYIELVVSHIICDNSTHTWVVTRHKHGISALVSQKVVVSGNVDCLLRQDKKQKQKQTKKTKNIKAKKK